MNSRVYSMQPGRMEHVISKERFEAIKKHIK